LITPNKQASRRNYCPLDLKGKPLTGYAEMVSCPAAFMSFKKTAIGDATDRHSKNGLLTLPNWVLTFVVAFIKNYL